MLPILLLGGAAAALFLSGCSKRENTSPGNAEPHAPGGAPPPPASNAPPSPPQPYIAAFGRDLVAAELYQRLTEAKVSDESLDRGCFSLDPRRFRMARALDHRIDACEVYDFTVDHYQKYPEITETLTGNPIPWSLDDRDPATIDDNKIRERIQETIGKLHESPGLKGADKKSDDFRRKMALTLSIFVDFPSSADYLGAHQEELKLKSEALAALGLQDFQKELLEKGGLGAAYFPDNGVPGITALQALAEKRGGNVVRAKILYGVLAQAELNPSFVFVTDKSNSDTLAEETNPRRSTLNFSGRKLQFLQVAIPLSNQDAATGRPELLVLQGLRGSPNKEAKIQEWGLTTFLAADLQEVGDYWLSETKELNPAVLAYKNAVSLNPTDSSIFNSSGVLLGAMNNPTFSEASFKEALRFDPANSIASYNLGRLYHVQGKAKPAVDHYLNVAVFSPEVFSKNRDIIEPAVQEVLKANANDENAKALASKIHQLRTDPDQ